MGEWSIHRARRADAPALAECFERAYATHDAITDPPPDEGAIARDIQENCVWVARDGRMVMGGVVLVMRPVDAKLKYHGVLPKAAGLGMGSALLMAIETHCRDAHVNYLKLTAHINMTDSLSFYEEHGWREVGRGRSHVQMMKSLSAH